MSLVYCVSEIWTCSSLKRMNESGENRRENMRETEVEGETDVRGAEACQNLLSDFSYKSVACKMTTTNFCGNI